MLLLILGLLIALPFFLESRIGSLLKNNVNNNINGTFDFEEAHLSLIRSFPRAELRVKDLYILNKAPFEGDTLLKAGRAFGDHGPWRIVERGRENPSGSVAWI